MIMPEWIRAIADTLMPRSCPVCAKPLEADEKYLCRQCLATLPRTHYEDIPFNQMEQMAEGRVPVKRAAGYIFYDKSAPFVNIIHDTKYRQRPNLGRWMAHKAATDMKASGFFDGIDAIVAVPLHFTKRAERGYNQAEYIARGLAEVLQVDVVPALRVTHAHDSQTRRDANERWKNAQGNYALSRHAKQIAGKHVLLVDDVVTTGATLLTCAAALRQVSGVEVSLFALAVAHKGL